MGFNSLKATEPLRGGSLLFTTKLPKVNNKDTRKTQTFSLMYGFCSNMTLYSASLLLTTLIFTLAPYDTGDCYYFESTLSLCCQ